MIYLCHHDNFVARQVESFDRSSKNDFRVAIWIGLGRFGSMLQGTAGKLTSAVSNVWIPASYLRIPRSSLDDSLTERRWCYLRCLYMFNGFLLAQDPLLPSLITVLHSAEDDLWDLQARISKPHWYSLDVQNVSRTTDLVNSPYGIFLVDDIAGWW